MFCYFFSVFCFKYKICIIYVNHLKYISSLLFKSQDINVITSAHGGGRRPVPLNRGNYFHLFGEALPFFFLVGCLQNHSWCIIRQFFVLLCYNTAVILVQLVRFLALFCHSFVSLIHLCNETLQQFYLSSL